MADVDQDLTPEEIRAKVADALRKRSEAGVDPGTRARRKREHKQRKGRVNNALLRGEADPRDELWTIRTKASHKRAVAQLADDLSEPRAKVTIAALMDEAVELLLAKYRGEAEAAE